ncbi:MAG: biotin--[acetyl-CoA-carboxylase] ligase [Candidatus Accumulibacter sp.]|jgi:BirA family biotin operon repressor/biotin-[acetyl-CoA-carboxylase] ligase|nr:biotin--[acetyl-CoA-carboxylase] ligase [Accumulibacter sp.]
MSESSSLLIDPRRLHGLLTEAGGRFDVVAVTECASTNTELMRRAAAGAPSGTALVADRQTAGRGSRGRSWTSSPDASLTFSVLWTFSGGLARLSGLSLAAGVAVARALARCGAAGVTLKWPNDVLHGEAKLGGILVELGADGETARAVVGVGLNLRLPRGVGETGAAGLPPAALDGIVAALPDRHVLLAALLDELARAFDRFEREGFAGLRDAWQALHAWQDRPVRLLRDGRVEKEGVCAGADADGALLLRTAGGLERCLSGDVSLRPR